MGLSAVACSLEFVASLSAGCSDPSPPRNHLNFCKSPQAGPAVVLPPLKTACAPTIVESGLGLEGRRLLLPADGRQRASNARAFQGRATNSPPQSGISDRNSP